MNLIESLEWRYACKKMNGQPVPEEKINTILEAIRLAPTSMGLQPFTVLVVTDPEMKKKIQPAAYNQSQITDCSHLLVFATWSAITEEKLEEYIAYTAEVRQAPLESMKGLRDMLTGALMNNSGEQNSQWAARQAYIAFGVGLTAAAMEAVDATPMEGFNPAGVDEILGLSEKGLKSVCLMAIGFRDTENDWLVNMTKVRRQPEKFYQHIG